MKIAIFRILAIFAIIATTLLNWPGVIFANDNQAVQATSPTDTGNIVSFYRGPLFTAVEQALSQEGPTKNDLISRELFTLPKSDGKGGMIPGEIKLGEIEKLANSGVYHVSEANILELGPEPSGMTRNAVTSTAYKYALMVTKRLSLFYEYKYRGHEAFVDIPANITLASGTIHNLYTTHLGLPNGTWVESGVGWVNWASSPIIFTYSSYTNLWTYLTIPSGYARTVTLYINISTGYQASMLVYDPYSGMAISSVQQVTSLNHRVDQCQEQASDNNVWTSTPQVRQHDNYVKNTSNTWVHWNNSINTDWFSDSPLHETHGIQNDLKWINTWCTP